MAVALHPDALNADQLVTELFEVIGMPALSACRIVRERGVDGGAELLGQSVEELEEKLSRDLYESDRICAAIYEVGPSLVWRACELADENQEQFVPAWRAQFVDELTALLPEESSPSTHTGFEALTEVAATGSDELLDYLWTAARRLCAWQETAPSDYGTVFETFARERPTAAATRKAIERLDSPGALWLDALSADQGECKTYLLVLLRLEAGSETDPDRQQACTELAEAIVEGRFEEVIFAAQIDYKLWELDHAHRWVERARREGLIEERPS